MKNSKSYYLSEHAISLIEAYKQRHGLSSNSLALENIVVLEYTQGKEYLLEILKSILEISIRDFEKSIRKHLR